MTTFSKYPFKTVHYPAHTHPEDTDPTVYVSERAMPLDDLLQEAGLGPWARGVVRRELADARGVRC